MPKAISYPTEAATSFTHLTRQINGIRYLYFGRVASVLLVPIWWQELLYVIAAVFMDIKTGVWIGRDTGAARFILSL